ncbi:hypothetical protein V5O48_019595, partial [Marasmius crinis-equi]
GLLDSLRAGSHNGGTFYLTTRDVLRPPQQFQSSPGRSSVRVRGFKSPGREAGKRVKKIVPQLYREAKELIDAIGYLYKE